MTIPFLQKKRAEIPEKVFEEPGIAAVDIAAPSSIELRPTYMRLEERLVKTYFIFSYPRYISTGWFSPVINLDVPMDIALFLHPIDTGLIMKQLRKKVTEVQAEIMEREEKGLVRDPQLEIAYQDLETLRDKLQTAQERMFRLGVYLTVYASSEQELRDIELTLRGILESKLVYIKPALYQQKEGFISTSPYGLDQLEAHTPMNTGPISSIFPFTSFDLSSNEGILYGINRHNNSLVLFDRFTLENANEVVFGVAGSGKSYAVKLEVLRSLMTGTDVIIIDPENEYKWLAEAVGGSFFDISLTSPHHINPFDLPAPREDERISDVLRSNTINLVGLLRIMLGGLTPEEDSIIDQAIMETYAAKDITPDADFTGKEPPLMGDFEAVLQSMEGAESLARRVQKFTRGSFAEFFNQPSNVNMQNNLVVFGIRDMEDELRPIATFIVLRYIWNTVRSSLKKRLLIVDEAWWLMSSEDGASFLYGTVKRARKYWLGVTTITQDIGDFMKSTYGIPIITNSALRLLMKQSTATIDAVKSAFNLSEEETYLLVESAVGEGVFFAGAKHAAVKIVAAPSEHQLVTTAPGEVVGIKRAKEEMLKRRKEGGFNYNY